jgi:hypothetical protein
MRKLYEYGGMIASTLLIVFGVGAIVVGFAGRDQVRSDLAREQIVGTPDMKNVANQKIDTGAKARDFAAGMRVHALEATGGQTYSQMARYQGKNGQPTDDKSQAAINPKSGKPVDNPARQVWVTETALSTALNTSYFAEQVALFSIVMGIALLLAGAGFGVVTARVLHAAPSEAKRKAAPKLAEPVAT